MSGCWNALTSPPGQWLLELMERRQDTGSTVFCTQYATKNWHARLGGAVHADAIMERIVHNVRLITTGPINMRQRIAPTSPITR